ncbi:MAG: hypothetical protein ACKVOW_12810 [Chitinophagaceae bacterium]
MQNQKSGSANKLRGVSFFHNRYSLDDANKKIITPPSDREYVFNIALPCTNNKFKTANAININSINTSPFPCNSATKNHIQKSCIRGKMKLYMDTFGIGFSKPITTIIKSDNKIIAQPKANNR